ncbi:hypothetical protein HYW68_01215 [Candidatus Parcubacteria bacterium]|nr:hypothetical protein [Candidatus Parcubacteria bacterium]
MEAYKTTCADCGHVRFWSGYKTGIGKTPEQLRAMKEEMVTCVVCGSRQAVTDLDHETKVGNAFDAQAQMLVQAIAGLLRKPQLGTETSDGKNKKEG